MNKRRIAVILATICLVASLYLFYQDRAPDPSKVVMKEISKTVVAEKDTGEIKTEEVIPRRTEEIIALKEINSEVLGIISVPGTNIDYPIMKSSDN